MALAINIDESLPILRRAIPVKSLIVMHAFHSNADPRP